MSLNLQLFSAPTLSGTLSVDTGPLTVSSTVPAQETQLSADFSAEPTVSSFSLSTSNSTYQDGVCVTLLDSNNAFVDADCMSSEESHDGTF